MNLQTAVSEQFLTQNIASPDAVALVVLEEIGHFLDSQLNTVDSQGDEGELFANLIQNKHITKEKLAILKDEDDSTTLVLDDKMTIGVEQSSNSNFLPAFPEAEGFGAASVGGRGGQVIEVTNLNDSGPGSLRAALETDGSRIVVFKVGGTIELNSSLIIDNPYITIAGQTAPGGGITLKNSANNPDPEAPLKIKTHDVVLRYISSRPGASESDNGNIDALNIIEGSSSEVYNVVVDHTSLSWSTDEVMSVINQVQNVSIQWSIIAEGLEDSTNPEGPHSMGLMMYKDGQGDISVHHNLLAHNRRRNPLVKTTGVVDVVNNVIYNPGFGTDSFSPTHVRGEYGLVPVNYLNNYFKPGKDTGSADWFIDTKMEPVEVYVRGNVVPNDVMHPDSSKWVVQDPHPAPLVTTTSASEAYNQVLAEAGSSHGLNPDGTFFLRRDSIDSRIVKDVKQGTGKIIDDPSQVGGWSDIASGNAYIDTDRDGMADVFENMYGFNPNDSSDNVQDADGDGYTNIEEFLNATNPLGNSTNTPIEPTQPNEPNNIAIQEVKVNASSDDAEESTSGKVDSTSSDLELISENDDQTVGMRFRGLNIPQGATITNAYIQFQVDESTRDSTNLIIQGEANNNAATFRTQTNDISSRPRTTASVNWLPEPWSTAGEAGLKQRTPELNSIIQEIVNQKNWESGNSLVTIITGSGERTAESFDGDSSGAPLLHVKYSTTANNGNPPLEENVTSTSSENENSADFTVTEFSEFSTMYTGFSRNGTVEGISFKDEDILAFDVATKTWSLYFDGSDVGLRASEADISAFHLNSDGSILFSLNKTFTLPDVGSVRENDIVRFIPTSIGNNTAGTYEWYLDGSDIDLTDTSEDIDAISVTTDDRLVISTKGSVNVTGVSGKDEDLLVFDATSIGESTSGSFKLYMDSSDVGLGDMSSEDINATWIDDNGNIYLSTDEAFDVPGISGDSADVVSFSPSSFSSNTSGNFNSFWDGSKNAFASKEVDGLSVV